MFTLHRLKYIIIIWCLFPHNPSFPKILPNKKEEDLIFIIASNFYYDNQKQIENTLNISTLNYVF